MPRKWLTGQIDLSLDSFTMQMPKTHSHSTMHPCAAQSFLHSGSVGFHGNLWHLRVCFPFELRKVSVCPQRLSLQ